MAKIRKALTAAVAAGLAAVADAIATTGFDHINWGLVVTAVVVAGAAVWGVPNADDKPGEDSA